MHIDQLLVLPEWYILGLDELWEVAQHMATDAQRRANAKYRQSHYTQLNIDIEPDIKIAWQNAANAAGQKMRAYIIQAVQERMERDAQQAPSTPPEVAPPSADGTTPD